MCNFAFRFLSQEAIIMVEKRITQGLEQHLLTGKTYCLDYQLMLDEEVIPLLQAPQACKVIISEMID